MTPHEISETIQNCLSKGLEERIGKHHIEEALDSLVPLLGIVPHLEKTTEYDYLFRLRDEIDNCSLRGERLVIRYAESGCAEEKSRHTEAKRISKSLDMGISLLQSRLKEVQTL
tara:strand:- start:318 stop:659 length:342 start_codon:yes stop_codon:yes gene_type:complete